MADEAKSSNVKSGGAGPTLFYVMLGVILALLLLFLILRPKGTQAGASDQKKSSLELFRPQTSSTGERMSDVRAGGAPRAWDAG